MTPIHRALGLGPTPLSWALFERAVSERVKEAADLDWKRTTYPEGGKWPFEAVKDLAAMANSGGGWIVFGIADKDDRADEITGVNWSSVHEQRLLQVAVDQIFPPLGGLQFFDVPSPDGAQTIAVMKVPAHGGSHHFVCPSVRTYKVPYRNGAHTEFHGPREVGTALLAYSGGARGEVSGEQVGPIDRLTSWLLDPTKAVAVHDLVMAEVATVIDGIKSQPVTMESLDGEAYETVLLGYRDLIDPLLVDLIVTGIWHDHAGAHDQVWVDVLQKLVTAGTSQVLGRPYQEVLLRARLYPALLTLVSAGVAAVARGRERLFIRMCIEVTGARREVHVPQPACQILHPHWLLDRDWVNSMPRWAGGRWTYAASHLLNADTRAFFSDLIPDDDEFVQVFHGTEYRLGLLQEETEGLGYRALDGEYVGELGWTFSRPSVPHAENAFRAAGERHADWPWTDRLGGAADYDQALKRHRAVLENYKHPRMH